MKKIEITDSYITNKSSFDRFALLQNTIKKCTEVNIHLDICINQRFGFTFVFLFANLIFIAEKFKKNLIITLNEKSFNLLKKIGLLCKKTTYQKSKNYFHEIMNCINVIDEDIDVFNLVKTITREAPVEMSDDLSALFISKSGEMYNNAKEHSEGIVVGGKYFKNQKDMYCFACYDNGIGIPTKVRTVKHEINSDLETFKWAMIDGHSTTSGNIPRGLGLGMLKSFARANDGTIRICSGRVLYIYNNRYGEIFHELSNEFIGTLFEMDIIADNNHKYVLK